MNTETLFSSAKEEWATPQHVFDYLNNRFGPFDLDPCATAENAKCSRFYTKEDNGLKQPWDTNTFCNPPYGRHVGQWIEKGYKSSVLYGVNVCMLVAARTETVAMQEWGFRGEVYFIKGRIKFDDGSDKKNSAPFPSCVNMFGEEYGHRVKTIDFKEKL